MNDLVDRAIIFEQCFIAGGRVSKVKEIESNVGTKDILPYPVIGKAACKSFLAETKGLSWIEDKARQFGEIGDIKLPIGASAIWEGIEHGRIWIELRAKSQGRGIRVPHEGVCAKDVLGCKAAHSYNNIVVTIVVRIIR